MFREVKKIVYINIIRLVVSNLEKKKIMGIESNGMVLTAANGDASKVVLLNIPADTPAGEKLV